MSCFVCSDRHLQVLVSFLDAKEGLYGTTAQEALDNLGRVNLAAINHRYAGDLEFEPSKYKGSAQWTMFSPVQILKLCDCYEYQADGHPEWDLTAAPHLINRIRSRAIDSLPGYKEAEWSI